MDLYPLYPGVSGGIVPWVEGVLARLARDFPATKLLLFHRAGDPPLAIVGENVEYVALNEHPVHFYEQMTQRCEAEAVNCVIRTYPQEYHPNIPFERQIFVIPDIQHEYLPELFGPDVLATRRRAFAYALSAGGAIATMTNHSRCTLLEQDWTQTEDIFLMPAAPPADLPELEVAVALPEAARRFDAYFYMPANLWPHKNHRRLLQAFSLALERLPPNTGLVLSGHPEGFEELRAQFPGLPVVHLGFVPGEQVGALLRNAIALVYFSLFEGFGMPVLEALHHGTPVLCSNTTSLPEVGGAAVLSCDPLDIGAMADLMVRIVRESGLRETLLQHSGERLVAYDWSKSAAALHSALERRASAQPRQSLDRQAAPRIGIVMPTRNQANFIRAAIDSVLSQDYPLLDFIVMDGASTDGTIEILRSYGDRVRWLSAADKGQTVAINKGFTRVDGEIMAYFNSDDVLLPGALWRVAEYFHRHPETDLLYGEADYIDGEGRVIGSYATADYTFERLMDDCCICQPAAFWRRRAARRAGPFNDRLETTMDYEYWLRLASQGAIIRHTDARLAQSRLHEETKTFSMRDTIFEEIFRICRAYGGYVSLSYHISLWSHRMYETSRWGSGLRRVAPWAHGIPALIQFGAQVFVLRKDPGKLRLLSKAVYRAIDSRLPFAGAMLRRTWRSSSLLRRRLR